MADPGLQPKDEYKGIELLGDLPGQGYLQQDPESGKAYRVSDDQSSGPRIEGHTPSLKALGIGGTEVKADDQYDGEGRGTATSQATHEARAMSPDELMAMANQMEASLNAQTQAARAPGNSAVQPVLERSARYPDQPAPVPTQEPAAERGPAPWLQDYMSKQPFTDPYHQVPMSPADRIKSNKYMNEKEKLKYMKGLKNTGKPVPAAQ